MSRVSAISERDLRMRLPEIMDALERGETFTVMRDGREVAELLPAHRPRRFVSRARFMAAFAHWPWIEPSRLRHDRDSVLGGQHPESDSR